MSRLPTPLLVFGFFLALYTATASGYIDSSDGRLMYAVAVSMAEDGSVAVRDGVPDATPGPDGRGYARYGLGISCLMVPFHLAGVLAAEALRVPPGSPEREVVLAFAIQMLNPVVVALTCALLYRFGRRLGWRRYPSLVVVAAHGAASLAWPHAKHVFAHPSAILFVLCSAYLIRRAGRPRDLVAAGLAAGMAVLIYMNCVLSLGALTLYVLLRARRESRPVLRALAAFGLGVLPGLMLIAGYNWMRFGSPFESGYAVAGDHVLFQTPLLYGLYGVLLSSGKSVFLYSPPLVLAAFAGRRFHRLHREEAVMVAVLVTTYVFGLAKLNVWHGDWAWGLRYQAIWHPFALLVLGPYAASRPRRVMRSVILAAVLALGMFIQVLGVSVSYRAHLIRVDASQPAASLRDWLATPHFVPDRSPLAGHAMLLPAFAADALARLRGGFAPAKVTFGEGWLPVEVMDGWTFRRAGRTARLGLGLAPGRARNLELILNDNYRPPQPPAEVRFILDGRPLDEVRLGGRAAKASPLLLPNRNWVLVGLTLGVPMAAAAGPHELVVQATAWNASETHERDFGIAVREIRLDGERLPLDPRVDWRRAAFHGEHFEFTHGALDFWWVKVLYTDLPPGLLLVPVACLALMLAAGRLLVARCREA